MKRSHCIEPKTEHSLTKRTSFAGALILAVTLAVAACAPAKNQGRLFKIPWPNAEGKYVVQDVAIQSFDRPESLQSMNIELLVNPFMNGQELQSAKPVGRFSQNKKGVSVPADYTSTQGAVIHAHFERLRQLDEQLGVQLNWPMKIGIQANIVAGDSKITNNAIYDGKLNALLVVPYDSKRLPVAMNAGVLAHEHFHMIFQALVLNHLSADNDLGKSSVCEWKPHSNVEIEATSAMGSVSEASMVKEYNAFYLRALNEGLADYWAWVYSGDVNFVAKSLNDQEGEARRLDKTGSKLKSLAEVKADVEVLLRMKSGGDPDHQEEAAQALIGKSYRTGTQYARALVEATVAAFPDANKSRETRLLLARSVLEFLPTLARTAAQAEKTGAYISTDDAVQLLQKSIQKVSVTGCQTLEKARVNADVQTESICVSAAK